MAWSTPATVATGELATSAWANQYIRDQFNETVPAKIAAAGDLPYGSAANAVAVLPIGAAGAIPKVNAGATAPEYLALTAQAFLKGNAAGTSPEYVSGVEILDKDHTQDENVGAPEASMYSYTITGGVVGANGGIRVVLVGDALPEVDGPTMTLKAKLGATTVFTTAALALGFGVTNRRKWLWELWFLNQGAENSQVWGSRIIISDDLSDNFAVAAGADVLSGAGVNTSAEDMSSNKVLEFTSDWGTFTTPPSWRRELAIVQRVG